MSENGLCWRVVSGFMAAAFLPVSGLFAADGTWTGAESALWTNSANWSAAPYPGEGTGETAVFDGSGNGNTVVDLDGLSSIRWLTFDTPAAASYTLGSGGPGGQTLALENSAYLSLLPPLSASQLVDATLQLGTNRAAATYNITNASPAQITLSGGMTGAPSGGTAGQKTVYVGGNVLISGVIANGGASSLRLYFTRGAAETDVITLEAANTFTGSVDVRSGILVLKNSAALGSGNKTVTIANSASGARPSIWLDGSEADLDIPSSVSWNTSNAKEGALVNIAGNNVVRGNFTLTSGDGDTWLISRGGKLTLTGNFTATTTSRALQLRGDGDGEISGVISNGSTPNMPVRKSEGSGKWTLSGANTYSGFTEIIAGTLEIAGEAGRVNASTGIFVNAGATLRISNTAAANHADRLNDDAPLAMNGAAFVFANDGGAADFSETAGMLVLQSGVNTVSVSQAAEGQTSVLTFSGGLSRFGTATVNFVGEGVGTARNRIFITGQAEGPIGSWATVNGSGAALYSASQGVYTDATGIAAKGDTIINNPGSNVSITSEGTSGPNELSDTVTVIGTLAQNSDYASTVNTADKTLKAGAVIIAPGKADLTLGVAPGDGTLAASGGGLAVVNNSGSMLTVNAVVADDGGASALNKSGEGTVVLAGPNTFSGDVSVLQGVLLLANSLALQNAVLGTSGAVFDSSVASGGFTVGNLTKSFALPLADNAANPVTLSVGNNNADSQFDGAVSGAGSLHKVGSGTLRLTGTSTYSGGTRISGGALSTGVAGGLGAGPVTNDATLHLTAGNVTYTALGTSLSGAGTVNVTLSTGSTTTPLDGDYSAFTGVWNLGVGGTGGKARMNGADNAGATVNVLSNATVYVAQPVVKNATAVLYGGDTGESNGQMRMDAFSEWAGPVFLAGDITGSGDGFFGAGSSTTGFVSGVVSDLNGPHPVHKVGSGRVFFMGTENTFAGQVWVRAGALGAVKIGNVGELSSLGQQPNAADAAIKIGVTTSAARLIYLGEGETTDRAIDMAGTTGSAIIEQSGGGLLKFTSDVIFSGIGNKTLQLDGNTDGVGELAGVLANGEGAVNKLVKTGTGKWIVSGANTYSGETEVQNGTLVLTRPDAVAQTSQFRLSATGGREAFLELAHDGGAPEKSLTIGVGTRGTILSGVGSGSDGINHSFNEFSLSATTLTVSRASNVLGGSPTITARTLNLSGGGTYTTTITPIDADVRIGRAAILSNSNPKTLRLDGTSHGNVVTGAVYNGLNTLSVYKDNTGTWTFEGPGSYSGATTVNNGTLAVSGAEGAITNSSGFTVNAAGVLRLSNAPEANHANRLADNKGVTLNGGRLDFTHTGGGADYSETVGAVTAAGAGSVISVSRADAGRTSALTLASLTRTGNGTLDFIGDGLGADDRNRIFIGGQADGLIGFWSTYNGAGLAMYDGGRGVYGSGDLSVETIAARGPSSVIPDDASASVRITSAGDSGPVTLAGATVSRVGLLTQATDTPAVIDTASKTFLAHGLAIEAGQASLTVGVAVADGTLTAASEGGKLSFANASESALAVNATLADNAQPVSVDVSGPGEVVFNGATLYTGTTAVNNGALVFGGHAVSQTVTGVVSGNGSVVKRGTNLLYLTAANTYTGPTYLNEGVTRVDKNTALGTTSGGVVSIVQEATLDVGCTPDVGGTRANNQINFGTKQFTVSGIGHNGQGAIVNNSTGQQQNAFSRINLAGDARFGGKARWDIRSGILNMNGHTFTKVGTNSVVIPSTTVNADGGHFDVAEGILRFESATTLGGNADNTVTVRGGAELELYRMTTPILWTLIMAEGASFDVANNSTAATQNRWDGPVVLNGAATLTGGGGYVADIRGPISGTGPLIKTGAANITLSETNNTYTGMTRINNGVLSVSRIGSIGEPNPLGQQATVEEAAVQFSGGSLAYTGEGETVGRVFELYSTGGAGIIHNGTGPLFITNNLLVSGTGSKTLTLRGDSFDAMFSGVIANGAGTISVTKSDPGRWFLTGNNVFTGSMNVNMGTLVVAATNTQGSGAISIGNAGNSNAIMRVQEGALIAGTGQVRVGLSSGSAGALYVTGGVINRNAGTGDDSFGIGVVNNNNYGYFHMSGGAFTNSGRMNMGGSDVRVCTGIARITGGTMQIGEYILIARTNGCYGVLTLDGGSITRVGASQNISLAHRGGIAELNITGGLLDNGGRNISIRQGALRDATGVVSLCAGTLKSNMITNYGATAWLNFNGGTYVAGASTASFVPATMTRVTVNGAFGTYAGGAVIDTDGRNVTIGAPLQAPVGNGVMHIAVDTPGSGYVGEPYVAITGGGGEGATAVANMEDDGSGNGTYRVASITVTNPGWSYSSEPTVQLLRGGTTQGGTVFATAGLVTLAPNTSGGLTKQGNGVLTLGAANTYTGVTTVAGGTLKLGNAAALPTQTRVVLAGGTLDLSGYTVTNTISGAGTLANGTVETVLSPGGEGVVATDTLPLAASVTLKGTYLLDVTTAGDSDLVAVQGDVNLDNLALQVVDPNLLDRTKTYTIMTCAGTRTGKFTPVNLPDSRWRVIYGADGSVKLFFVTGTVVIFR